VYCVVSRRGEASYDRRAQTFVDEELSRPSAQREFSLQERGRRVLERRTDVVDNELREVLNDLGCR
jgi:hypothetical protein